MHVSPITCLRPSPEHVTEFAALPYDVFSDAEARAYVSEHPTSFLAIDRPETGFPQGQDPSAPEVYEHAVQLLRDRQLDGTLVRDETPCYYVYEQRKGDHSQMGLMAAVAADDYLDGTLRRHELTLLAKEEDRVRHITRLRAQTGPVFIAYPDNAALDFIIGAATQAAPLYDFTSEDGVRQRVWRVARKVAVDAIGLTFSQVDRGYIADGHHRAAAAVRICEQRRQQGRTGDPAEEFLAVLFPASQLRILPYDRVVSDTNGLDEPALVSALQDAGFACSEPQDEPIRPHEQGVFGMFAFGHWRELHLEGARPADPVGALDVSLLQERVLSPVLGIHDPRTDGRISFVGGAQKRELAERAGADGVAFLLYPTSMDELMAVADAKELMPPKSTWFDPKLLSGLALRRIW